MIGPEEDDKVKMGRLIEDAFKDELGLFSRGTATVSFTRIHIDLGKPLPGNWTKRSGTGTHNGLAHTTFHGRWQNIHRGQHGSKSYSRSSGWTDYIDRSGRFSNRQDIIAIGGHDRQVFTEAVNASKKAARKYNDAILLTVKLPVPRELSVRGMLNVMDAVAEEIHASGRVCAVALHDAPDRMKNGVLAPSSKGNFHIHIRASARPLKRGEMDWLIGKGKFIPDRAAMIDWRERYAATVNRELQREQIPDSTSPRYHPGKLADIGIDRPAKRRVSAAAAMRDDPDLARPGDQFNLEWNRAIDEGRDPNQDQHIIEERARVKAEREIKRQDRERKAAEKAARRTARIDALPEVIELRRQQARQPAENLPSLSEDYISQVVEAHRRAKLDLSPTWRATQEGRKAAEAVRSRMLQRSQEASLRAAQRRERQQAEARAQELRAQAAEEQERQRAAELNRLEEVARQEAAQHRERSLAEAAHRRRQQEAAAKNLLPSAAAIVNEVRHTKGILRCIGDDVAKQYPNANGNVARLSHAFEFLKAQPDETLLWIFSATTARLSGARPHSDERDVLDGAVSAIRHEAQNRKLDLSKSLAPSGSTSGTPRSTPSRQEQPQRQWPRKRDGHGR